jgi:serine/threonine protein kinase
MVSHTDPGGVREGDILAGKYRIERVLGQGAMGVVVAAHHLELDARVAIKFLLPSTLGLPKVVARFAREARAAVKIKSEHVARVIDVGKLENGAPYIVMEYLEGEDLGAWVQTRGRLPVAQAVLFVLQACEAVAAAHAIGIVHRDLKPSNLFVIRLADGSLSVKVLDFGISKLASRNPTDASITSAAALLGTPLYMPPEQMRSARDVDARSDIWALGALLHHLLAGEPPFSGSSLTEVMASVLDGEPRSLRASLPDAPAELEAVIAKCLQKRRGQRYANVGALAKALLPFAPARGRLSVERIEGILRASEADATERSSPAPRGREGAAANTTRLSWAGTDARALPLVDRHSATRRSPTPLRLLVLAGAGLAAMVGIGWLVLGRLATGPEKRVAPVTSRPAARAVSASPAVASNEQLVVPLVSSVVVPQPSGVPGPLVRSRRTAPVAAPRAVLPTPPPSATVEPVQPVEPAPATPSAPPISGGTFEDRK